MIFTVGMIMFVIGKFILEMNGGDLAFGHISPLEKGGVVLSITGLVLVLVSLSLLTWRYLP